MGATATRGDGVLELDGLTRSFSRKVAVAPFHVRIGPGGITGLLGPNGSGKTTLMRMIVGLVHPDGGSARVDGAALVGDGAAVRRRVAYLPGEIGVYGELTGREHLAWLLRGRGRAARRRGLALAKELELPLGQRVHGYSHGMKRQLLFAAAMAAPVGVRILDEPTEGLDPSKRAHVLDLLRRDVSEAGTTVLFSSHHLAEVEHACDRVLFLHGGRLVDEDEARSVAAGARRLVRLAWDAGTDAGRLAERVRIAMREIGIGEGRVEGTTATLVLPGDDPRAALRALLDRPDLPPPRELSYGTLSLQELYRVLYGEEGI